MKRKPYLVTILLVTLTLVLSSCVKDGDFAQEEVAVVTPNLKSELVLSSYDAHSFIDKSSLLERDVLTDTIPLELNTSELFIGELRKASLKFKLTNSLQRDFKADFEFLNDANELKFSVHIPVSSGSKETPITVETNVLIQEPETTSFIEATKLLYKITLLPSDNHLSFGSEGSLDLQSKATYFFE